jgi:uncharacterized protein (DUF983 family)
LSLWQDVRQAFECRCPLCHQGRLFKPYSITVVDECAVCHAKLSNHDIGDGAAVFLLFILGFTLVPLAWFVDLAFAWPLWVHALLWTVLGLGATLLLLPTTKAYIIMLEYRHLKKEGE